VRPKKGCCQLKFFKLGRVLTFPGNGGDHFHRFTPILIRQLETLRVRAGTSYYLF
jgi:hypothetical protein